jgi:hypothetical protein
MGKRMEAQRWAAVIISFTCITLSAQVIQPGVDPHSKDVLIKEYADLSSKIDQSLRQRATDIQSILDLTPQSQELKTIRGVKTKLWLRLLDEIDSFRDIKFDFEDRPLMKVLPPLGSTSIPSYFGSLDPKTISDPEIRLQYEEAIRQNNEKAVRYHLQLRLKMADEQYTAQAVQYLASAYDKTSEDAGELTRALNGYLRDEPRKVEMRKKLHEILDADQLPK